MSDFKHLKDYIAKYKNSANEDDNASLCEKIVNIVTDLVKQGYKFEDIKEELKTGTSKNFYDNICNKVNEDLRPYFETHFLKDMDFSAFQNKMEFIFENMILYTENIKFIIEQVKDSKDNIMVCLKVLNTTIKWYIVERMSKRLFTEECKSFFGFNLEFSNVLWEMFSNNRSELITREIIRVTESVYEFFDNIEMDDNEESCEVLPNE